MEPIDALSLGWRTELIFHRFDAQVTRRAEYLVVRTPHNPTYYWGNFLLFDRAPRAGDAAVWLAAFDEEITRSQPESSHLAFGIDGETPAALPDDFQALGVRLFPSTVLTMKRDQLRAPRRPLAPGFEMRAMRLPQEAPLAVEVQVASDAHGHEPAGYRVFRERQMTRYGRMAEAGLGHWFGIFAMTAQGQALVADCGLFRDGFGADALGRFQFVSTHPAWRRQGLCSALIHAVCEHGFDTMGLASLVIVADPSDVAIGLYQALGFVRDHELWYLERPSRDDASHS
ncbi:MAG: GNAT family protein [Burkholderiales bacterium]